MSNQSAAEWGYFDIILGTLTALSEAENADEFCKSMALNVLQEFGVIATYVARLDSDNRISMIGSFGYSRQRVENTGRPSIWENMSITETIRTGRILVYESWDDYIAKYPDKEHLASPGQSFICLPLKYHGSSSGGFGVTFRSPLKGAGIDERLWEALTKAGEVFLAKTWADELERKPVPINEYGEDARFAVGSLAKRERDVLALVADGMTNQQIAKVLNFSQSTIKQDTIRIFKVLGVKTREEAALAWKTLRSIDSL